MLRAYYYIYYKLFKWRKKQHGNDMPHFYAFLFMIYLQFSNFAVIYFILTIFDVVSSEVIFDRFEFIGFAFGYFALNYLFLVYRGRHKKFVSRFEKESCPQNSRRDFWFNVYILISVITFIGIFVYALLTIKFR
ncbi:MAG: hypothetical protein D8M61_05680 [Ignavibacteriae bacterium]|nr:hypothetical protein [Ignavibacteriota bacterium]